MTADLARELVRIPSVNPDGNPGTAHTGEKQCAEFLGDWLERQGASVSIEDVLPGRPNVVGRFPSDRPGKPRLLFAPHTDTVSVLGMTIDPFEAEIRDGKLWGRGASDTKGPMAAMLTALDRCGEILPFLSHEIWFAGLMGEEAGHQGAQALAMNQSFDFVIVGEPTRLQTVYTHKGSTWISLCARGISVHSSTPDHGKNAIERMMTVLSDLRGDFRSRFGHVADMMLGSPTLNIGTIQGGSKVNIVPDCCEAMVDIRTVPGQQVVPFLKDLATRHPDLEIKTRTSPALSTNLRDPLLAKLLACGASGVGAPWYCDAAIFSAAGSPSVAIGPGSIAQAHTVDEWIALDDLEEGSLFFERFVQSLRDC